jgi:uncharacterized membrane protein YeaQ/YmgE (transglycosylase-associated protein family)
MSWITWIVLGACAGIVARYPLERPFSVVLLDVGLGVLGACLGGWSNNAYKGIGVMTLTPGSALFAVLGAVVTLTLYHSIVYRRRRPTRRSCDFSPIRDQRARCNRGAKIRR